MKRIKFFAVAALLAISSGAYAQFTNSSSNNSQITANTDGWSTIWVEYNPIKMKYDAKGADDESLTGFSAGYSHAFCVSQGAPVFLEAGIGLQYAKYSDSKSAYVDGYGKLNVDQSITFWSAKVPVNILYCFELPNSSISLAPFVGITLRYNLSGTLKYEANDYSEKYDVFSDSDMDDLDFLDGKAWKRLQLGWQIGLKARLGQNFMAGISYGNDFSEIAYKSKIQTTAITVGYTF